MTLRNRIRQTLLCVFTLVGAMSVLSVSTGCTSAPKTEISGLPMDENLAKAQEAEIVRAEGELRDFHFTEAHQAFQIFQDAHRGSPFAVRAMLGEAKSEEGLGRWSSAILLYREVIEMTRATQTELTAEALYRLSFCYEAIGDETKTLASLLDAERLKDKLPPEVGMAEVPARIAASLYREGRSKEAAAKLEEAEQGLKTLTQMKSRETSQEWLAQTYFQMGLVSTHDLSFENFKPSLDTLKIVQLYLLKSIETQDPKWSPMANQTLFRIYEDLTQIVQEVPLNRSKNLLVAQREQNDRKAFLAGQVLESLNRLKSLQAPSNTATDEVFQKLASTEGKLVDILNRNPVGNSLTPEAVRNQRVKTDIIIKSAQPTTPEEKAGKK